MNETNADGGIVTFKATHPKWSFAKVNEQGLVTEVAEKKSYIKHSNHRFLLLEKW